MKGVVTRRDICYEVDGHLSMNCVVRILNDCIKDNKVIEFSDDEWKNKKLYKLTNHVMEDIMRKLKQEGINAELMSRSMKELEIIYEVLRKPNMWELVKEAVQSEFGKSDEYYERKLKMRKLERLVGLNR